MKMAPLSKKYYGSSVVPAGQPRRLTRGLYGSRRGRGSRWVCRWSIQSSGACFLKVYIMTMPTIRWKHAPAVINPPPCSYLTWSVFPIGCRLFSNPEAMDMCTTFLESENVRLLFLFSEASGEFAISHNVPIGIKSR